MEDTVSASFFRLATCPSYLFSHVPPLLRIADLQSRSSLACFEPAEQASSEPVQLASLTGFYDIGSKTIPLLPQFLASILSILSLSFRSWCLRLF